MGCYCDGSGEVLFLFHSCDAGNLGGSGVTIVVVPRVIIKDSAMSCPRTLGNLMNVG